MTFHIKKKHVRRFFFTAALIVLVFGLFQFFKGPGLNLPEKFVTARLQGTAIAQDIVGLISQSNARLDQISTYDLLGDYAAALEISAEALGENKIVTSRAIELSKQLEIMLLNLEQVSPYEAQKKAQSAILTEVQLINRLISYSDQLKQLLEELKLKLRAKLNGVKSPGVEIQGRIAEINREIRNINLLNSEFAQSMNEFDDFFQK